jgi:hypothetical protein
MPLEAFKSLIKFFYSANILAIPILDALWIIAEGETYAPTSAPILYEHPVLIS